jgi:hypothetical protein
MPNVSEEEEQSKGSMTKSETEDASVIRNDWV